MEKTKTIINEIEWLTKLIEARTNNKSFESWTWNDSIKGSDLNTFFNEVYNNKYDKDQCLCYVDRILLISTLSLNLGSKIFEPLLALKRKSDDPLSKKVGGIVNQYTEGLYPTLQTILFLACGNDLSSQIEATYHLFNNTHLIGRDYLQYKKPTTHSPFVDQIVEMDKDLFYSLITWKKHFDTSKVWS